MKLALIQMEIAEKNREGNIAHALSLLEEATPGRDIAVLPEIWTTGYSLGKLSKEHELIDGHALTAVRAIAQKNSCAIVAGSVPLKKEDGRIYNSSIIIDKNGEIVFCYSKVHLFKMFNEERFFAAGDNFGVYELNGITCGSSICYDLRFPELYRHLSILGAKIIFVPAEWPEPRGYVWELLNQARAMENNNFIVAVNCVGSFRGEPFHGHSMVVGPSGEILVKGGANEEILYCDIDLAAIDKVRSKINVFNDIRQELIK